MYKRIVLKLSGEALSSLVAPYDEARVGEAALVIGGLRDMGIETAVVLGGGNIWRGRFSKDMDPVNADQMGMLATIMNALAVSDALCRKGYDARVFTAQDMPRFTELYTARKADEALRAGGIALLAGGTGNPFFTTDTGAALRAAELKADAVFKGTTVEGVFDSDPRTNPDARLLSELTYAEAEEKRLKVMDSTAFTLCRERGVPLIRVFSMEKLDNILKVAQGDEMGSKVHA